MYISDDELSVDEEHTKVNDIQDQDTIPDTVPLSVQNTDVDEPDILHVETVTNKNNNVEARSDEVTKENNHPSRNLRK